MAKEMEDNLDCGGCNKSLEEVIYWKHIKRLRFCVVHRPDFQDQLPIPKKFAENMKPNVFHPKVTLRGPSGASWEVTLLNSVDGVFLRDGWEEFVKAHCLQENEILFFKYDRNSSFDVKIFNGQCEKEAAYFVKKCGHVNPAVKEKKRKVSGEIVDVDNGNGDEVCNTAKKICNEVRTPPLNEEQQGNGGQRNVRASKKILSRRKPIHLALQFIRKKAVSRSSKELQGGGSSVEPELTKDTDQNGSSNKDASSGDQIQPEVNEICTPDAAAFQKDTNQNGSLNKDASSGGQIQSEVNEICTPDAAASQKVVRKGSRPKGPRSSKKKSFGAIEYVSHRRHVTEEEKTAALRKAASELVERSFFAALPLSSCYKGYYMVKDYFMTVPAKFATEHFRCRNEDVILRVGEKKWLARYCFSTDKLGSGWRQFALDNNLEESDVCLFKLVSKVNADTMMFDVTIFRVVEEVTPLTALVTPPPLTDK